MDRSDEPDRRNEKKPQLMALNQAVQDFSNAICEDASQQGIVTQALVVWEEVSFNENGDPFRRVYYAVPGENFALSGAIGLCVMGLEQLKGDIL